MTPPPPPPSGPVDPTPTFTPGTFTPAPAPARPLRMLAAHARMEARMTLRNGEQVLLTLLIPMVLLIGLSLVEVIPLPAARVDHVMPGILALAVMSTAFTGQAIALGFDRRYGVIKRLAATALPRSTLIAGRVLAALAVVAVQTVVLGITALLLGWAPSASGVLWMVPLLVLGTLSFGALGVLLGGALRAEIVLAVANIVWFALVLAGGMVIPVANVPDAVAEFAGVLPSGALAEALHNTLALGQSPGWSPLVTLLIWGLAATALARRTTRLS